MLRRNTFIWCWWAGTCGVGACACMGVCVCANVCVGIHTVVGPKSLYDGSTWRCCAKPVDSRGKLAASVVSGQQPSIACGAPSRISANVRRCIIANDTSAMGALERQALGPNTAQITLVLTSFSLSRHLPWCPEGGSAATVPAQASGHTWKVRKRITEIKLSVTLEITKFSLYLR